MYIFCYFGNKNKKTKKFHTPNIYFFNKSKKYYTKKSNKKKYIYI